MIALRKQEPALTQGDQEPLRARNDILAFRRHHGGESILVLLNLAREPRRWMIDVPGKVLLSSHLDRPKVIALECSVLLRGNEGMIIKSGV